jgi:hypothetical protein
MLIPMSDFITKTLRFVGSDNAYDGFQRGQTYEVHYQQERHGIRLLVGLLLGQSDPKQTTLLVSENEFKKHWVTPE